MISVSDLYDWVTNIQASLYIGTSGYLGAIGYDINQPNEPDHLRIRIGDENVSGVRERTLTITPEPSFSLSEPTHIGASGWRYKFNVDFDIYTNQDRDVEVMLYNLAKFSKRTMTYYNWSIAVTGGLAAGATTKRVSFERPSFRRLRSPDIEPNDYLNYRGKAKMTVTVDTDSLL